MSIQLLTANMEVMKPGEDIKPKTDPKECKQIIRELYGLECLKISELNGYDDKNFWVLPKGTTTNNPYLEKVSEHGYVFKILNSLDSRNESLIDAQTSVVLFLSKLF